MIQWSIIGNSFITFLCESKASEEAKRRGLVPSKRRGYYEDPAKPGTIVAKSERGGMRLATVKPKDGPKKVSKKKAAGPTKKRPPKKKGLRPQPTAPASRTKAPAAKVARDKASRVIVPKNIKDFSSAAEATHGLVSGETSVNRAGQDVAIRHMMDPRTGKPIDVSKEAGRGVAIKLINDRHKQLHPKILQAVNVALSTKKGDASGTLAKKWLGELGELLALRDLLKEGTESYFLPASAQKNDLVIFSPVGDDSRDLKMAFVSVKSTKGGGEANGLGANIAADFSKILGNKTMTIGRQNVSAFEYADRAMKMKRSMIKFFTQGQVGRNGISVKGINPRLLQIKPEKIDHPTSKVGFSSQADFLKARVIDEKELAKFFKAYKEKLDESGVIGVQLAKNLQKKIAERRNIRRPDKFSVKDLDAWLTVELGRTLDETDTVAVAATDTMTARYAEGEGFVDTRIAVGEDVTKRTLEKAKERGLKLGKNGRPISGAQQVEMLMGLSQRTRALGKKDNGTAHLDGIINGTPTAKVQDIELSVSDYIDKIGFRRRTLDVPLGQR